MQARRQRLRKQKEAREGAVLLIVLLILLMATSTAVFAIQSSMIDQRAAGALHQAMRAKYVAESATVNVMALCYQGGTEGCTDIKRAPENLNAELRQTYGLPNYGGTEVVYSLTQDDMPIVTGSNFRSNASTLGDDWNLSKHVNARRTVFVPSFLTVLEKWRVPNPGETRERYRLIVSTYGEVEIGDLNADGVRDDRRSEGNEFRWGHEAISTTRAFFDVR